ncbi:xanthine dehydrogenase small subunit [Pusillimonas noertemannii]|uniref:Xanthine dehydrogenase small subunit n=1 Tax=Pusillimonas noertemannii TaxID=305977 RepID=A0A2U1CKE0_9BURK|nr:xanthine dehydrogenase small subunit [Pusillimonas noertemannii]NYT69615.1 xanthine dehydrogenase small subunit [Pusillimonas noertemannii]PVY61461.1 xanthine dehydrogenase small subunit [Pusillimonas noertemannii]TFL08943.1 xanthine dehydrogenase small subunit [Pusillimonas noertemannii]
MNVRGVIRFYLNGVLHEVTPHSPTQTVLQYLREDRRLTGTKEGCGEGDCGACTVTQASLQADGRLVFQAINACIRFLPTLDGKAMWTVEALEEGDSLHPVQQAMVDHHGSQCGFCTPGFVMSMYTMYQNGHTRPARHEVFDHLSGNLCRCTGYRPIIDAACGMDAYPPARLDHEAVRGQLQGLRDTNAGMLAIEAPGQSYFAPTTTDELAELYLQHPDAILLAGGTDVGLWVTKQLKTLPAVIYLGDIAELNRIEKTNGALRIAAAVSLNDGYEAVVQEYPEAHELWKRFASMPIRNSGTLVGNLANGSPIGDSAPLLIAIGSTVILRRGASRRELPLEDLYLDYRKQAREPGEFVEAVVVPRRNPQCRVATYKLSKRFDQDISAVCSAYALTVEQGRVASLRIAHGGMAATSRRARHAEEALLGNEWSEASVALAMQALDRDYQPLTDMRASDDYRRKSARNLLYRFYLESTGQADARILMKGVS